MLFLIFADGYVCGPVVLSVSSIVVSAGQTHL